MNVDVRFVRSVDSLLNAVREGEAALIIVDMHSQKIDPIALATSIKADEKLQSIPLLGFFSHVHAELHREAMSAGYDTVIPRSVFSRDLGKILAGREGDESDGSQALSNVPSLESALRESLVLRSRVARIEEGSRLAHHRKAHAQAGRVLQ